ncbi:unnamed protein product [Ixodes persulcatus]
MVPRDATTDPARTTLDVVDIPIGKVAKSSAKSPCVRVSCRVAEHSPSVGNKGVSRSVEFNIRWCYDVKRHSTRCYGLFGGFPPAW